MQATQTNKETLNISREKLVSFVSQMFGGTSSNPNPDEPHKPGPLDPIIRKVLRQMQIFGPIPVPWHSIFRPSPEPWRSESNLHRAILELIAARHPELYDDPGVIGPILDRAALNPQPIPPRAVFLAAFAQEVIDRAVLTQEIADAINQTGEQQGRTIVGNRLLESVEEMCGNNFKFKIPIPRPKHDTGEMLSGLELLAAGAIFEQNAAITANEGLRQELTNAGAKLIETGIARM